MRLFNDDNLIVGLCAFFLLCAVACIILFLVAWFKVTIFILLVCAGFFLLLNCLGWLVNFIENKINV